MRHNIMGLFNTIKKQKQTNNQAEWKIGLIPTIVTLEDTHMKIANSVSEDIVFYQDIMFLEQVTRYVNIRTNVKMYSLRSNHGSAGAKMLHRNLLEKMSKCKNQ